jgi:hypothetical protein
MILTWRRHFIMPATKDLNDDKETPKLAHKNKDRVPGTDNPDVDSEKSDINYKAIIKFGLWMTAAAFFIHGTMWVLFRYYLDLPDPPRPQPPSALATRSNRVPPKPQLQQDPIKDLKQEKKVENEAVNQGLKDPKTGATGLPIETAIDQLVQQKLPVRNDPPQDVDLELRLDSSSGRKPEHRLH